MRKSKLFPLAALTAAVLTASAVASGTGVAAENGGSTVMAGGQCTGSWVDVHETVVARARPDAASPKIFDVFAGETFPCRKLVVGAGYKACGYTGMNGWILVQDGVMRHNGYAGWSGYIPSICTSDR
ncbi:hypothetical protein [Amycolatopsis regifaucium]|uniref:SH3 domain-containing protein n=1 Tax=Amycolatopsis regifaucium TaxID=546365 RepID=A0A154MX91_9PSEU|nr:hypothetical protein [Amycolatopsis regifaucium]KZB88367.1 hypothetical protein AVL48_20710 [Amycolatopsis regifaucium]OKA11478.1 hypothetical protein ATP06_0201100 [Amycolatopsis regifaucium]SFH40696.1 hypothetical protein SAMN04489731_10438 [Amycolatopsis regifaucium]